MAFSSKITRRLTSFHMVRFYAKRANPGLSYQINAIDDAVEIIQSDPEGFEGLESDLFNAHKSYKEHEQEQKLQREKIKHYMIKTKYFRKDSLPNLLTYAEKEQIRYLHSTDEEEWTADKLADSFPANPEIVLKIIKSNWNAISPKRISAHDASVMRNWERFKNGEYKAIMPKALEEHLNKFANRDVNNMKISKTLSTALAKKQWQKPTSNEFSSIITILNKKNCATTQPMTIFEDNPEIGNICLNSETNLQGRIRSKKPITIHELKNKRNVLRTNENLMVSEEDNTCNELSKQKDSNNATRIVASNNNSPTCNGNDFYKKFAVNEVNIDGLDKKLYGISQSKKRIHIPRKLWRKGATYRADNCYYDDDGELLYKVPGISLQ